MTVRIIVGDCREVLRTLLDETFQLIMTSPPYFGLRDYGLPPVIWDGADSCEHEWGELVPGDARGGSGPDGKECYGGQDGKTTYARQVPRGNYCLRCHAWRGSLGNEPTLDLYIAHLVGIFSECRRVLRRDGVMFVNVGDSFNSSGTKMPNQAGLHLSSCQMMQGKRLGPLVSGLKPKDMCQVPARLALAMQADGWFLRCEIPWLKANPMPESVRDRPTIAHEKVFMFTRSAHYYWDQEAVKRGVTASTIERARYRWNGTTGDSMEVGARSGSSFAKMKSGECGMEVMCNPAGRTIRTTDFWNDALDALVQQQEAWLAHVRQVRAEGGLLLDPHGDPLALLVNTEPLKIAHYAAYPTALVEPFVKAATSEKGCCGKCGAPWVRINEGVFESQPDVRDPAKLRKGSNKGMDTTSGWNDVPRGMIRSTTLGWRPSCDHGGDPVPCRVLDPFCGVGTTMLVADRLGQHATGIELNECYAKMAERRIADDAGPMCAAVEVEARQGELL